MAEPLQPEGRGAAAPGLGEAELERRKRELDAKLAARQPKAEAGTEAPVSGMAGMAYGLRLSSEFIAAIVVGAGLGWLIDSFAGTTPWGLIVFLLLGFAAGVLNVLRSAGRVAESAVRGPGEPGASNTINRPGSGGRP